MKLSIEPSVQKRPFSPTFWLIFSTMLFGFCLVTVRMLAASSQGIRVVLLLIRIGFKLTPPAVWVGAGLIVMLWLVTLHRAWRN